MRSLKVLLFSLIFMAVSIYWASVPLSVSADENDLLVQVTKPSITPSVKPQPKPQLDCKAKDVKEEGDTLYFTLEGKDCQQAIKSFNENSPSRYCHMVCDCRGTGKCKCTCKGCSGECGMFLTTLTP